jgi:glycosyltransferase involved in cell wall biosynthesis
VSAKASSNPIDPASRTFLCIGRLNEQKGHLLLLDAFARLVESGAQARLVLAGGGELRGEIESRIAPLASFIESRSRAGSTRQAFANASASARLSS